MGFFKPLIVEVTETEWEAYVDRPIDRRAYYQLSMLNMMAITMEFPPPGTYLFTIKFKKFIFPHGVLTPKE